MKKFNANVSCIFSGTYTVSAVDEEEATKLVQKECFAAVYGEVTVGVFENEIS